MHHSIISFSYYQTGLWEASEALFNDKLGSCPVIVFFFLTGYLCFEDTMRSRILDTKYTEFLKKRFLRIYPAYFVSICLVLFFIFLETNFALLDDVPIILKSLISWMVVGLPNGIFQEVNQFLYLTTVDAGVIWSLLYEVLFYFLTHSMFVRLGRVSYSFYLLHGIVIYAIFNYGFLPLTLVSQIFTVAGLGVLVSWVSILSFKLVEQRFYKL
ncbi:MAG: acyltransferase family protein [Bdellovibrionaceae bacterium]|nr:acyltransferase family protein [Pseudobdellovibrionaceae bacterium]